ncbi:MULTISPECIES: hypothetical protein [unclassified Blautia]|uniref:hypothetical protein n=1 Tax=unclassified Blautia TaxID=2648079 RepID=UPI003F8C609E
MTKIKNTKKGMAKKTLSMSLVVAMLATSNVPVWAAEFSAGEDVAVTSGEETPAAETVDEFSDDTAATQAAVADEAPAVEDNTNAADAQNRNDGEGYYTTTIEVENTAIDTGSALSYTGTFQAKNGAEIYSAPAWYGPDGTPVNVGSEGNFFANDEGTYTLKATLKIRGFFSQTTYPVITLATVKAAKKISAESITGTVSISNEAGNQWGYKNKADYSAEVPEGVTLGYQWQYYDTDKEAWVDIKDATATTYTPLKEIKNADNETVQITGKKLRTIAKFTNSKNDQVIKEVESNNYEVAPLQIAAEDIKIDKDENFGMSEVNTQPRVKKITVSKKDVLGNTPLTEGVDFELKAQDPDKSGIRTVTVQLKGAYTGEVTETVNLSKYNLADCDVTLESKTVEFAGDGQYAAPVIKSVTWAGGKATLAEGDEYVVASKKLDKTETARFTKINYVEDCINAGKNKVDLIGRGIFTGTKTTVEFNIVARSMENCKVVWTGKPVIKGEKLVAGVDVKDTTKTHFVVVDQKGYVLIPDEDYTYDKDGIYDVSGQKCQVEVTATGEKDKTTGNYYGSVKSDFTTVGTNLSTYLTNYVASVVSSQDYTGKEITFGGAGKPSNERLDKITATDVARANNISVWDVRKVFSDDLEVGVDFDIVYKNNVNAYLLKNKTGALLDSNSIDLYREEINGVTHYSQEGNDFYPDNDDPQAPQVYLVFKGKYSGQTTPVRFAINQRNIDEITTTGAITFNPSATDANAMTTYADQVKALQFKDTKGNTLKDTIDYTYDSYYVNNVKDVTTEKGLFTLEMTAHTSQIMNGTSRISVYDGNYYGYKEYKANITPKSLKSESIKVADIASQKYNGKLIEPKVTVTDGSYTLVEGTDYKLSYTNNRSAGTATVTITGFDSKGRYKDAVSKTFTIENKSIADAKIMKKGSWNSTYTDLSKYKDSDYVLTSGLYNNDREVTTEFDVVDANNNLLRQNYDYTVEYKNNTKVGTATIIITGKGDYEGTLEGSFTIVGKGISGHFVEESIPAQTYTGEAIEPKVTFKPDSPNLVEGKDYEITYEYNVNPGKGDATDINNVGPKVVARGIGQYAGYVKLGFEIKKADISVADVKAEDAVYAGGKVAESKITVTNPASGKALKEGEDYTVEYVSGQNVGETGKAILRLVNNKCYTFGGDSSDNASITVTYKIVAKDLKDVTVEEVKDQTATGQQIKPTLTVLNGDVVMKEGVDYQVTYGDNTEVGVGTATITPVDGNKNYTGSKKVTFNIVEAKPEVGKATISNVVVKGNVATPVLSGDVDGAVGYDYVIATEEDYVNGRVDISKNVLKTNTNFYYVQEGTYYAYCHAWKRDENGKKVFGAWSNIKKFTVDATTPSKPSIKTVKVSGHTVTVTFTASKDAKGYDVVLGEAVKKVNGENRPVDYGKLVVKNIEDDVYTATFYNVPDGKYYAGVHSYNKSSNDGKKVFSKWGYRKTAISVGKAK